MQTIMNKIYNPKEIEQPLYEYWEKQGYFKPNNNSKQNSYCIMMPPPNITGSLHMGHAFQQTIMDIIIRYQRMQGKNTLWQVGIDHAGIATQILVEQKIAVEEGKTRQDYSRDIFIKKMWEWTAQSSSIITGQMRRLGNSVDWERNQFTLNENLSNAVIEAFIRLYHENLIYRGKRLVNWDPKLRTALSDLEVDYSKFKSAIWSLRYPLADGERTAEGLDYLVVTTTRPETMLGDTGVAVNPKDPRFCNLIGKFIILPIVKRRIPIIGDEYADITKGTGCVKITPAHDFNDYEVGKRHKLPMINILTYEGNICQKSEIFNTFGKAIHAFSNEIPMQFRGLERFTARNAIVEELDRQGLVDEVIIRDIVVPYSNRGGVIIEPMLTDQWYIRTAPLAKRAIEAVKNQEIKFVPKQYENMYFSWMNNIQDWCISRQLWWGHRIPAWYDVKGNVYVDRNETKLRQRYCLDNEITLYQDNDVLDTWFSSALWTFATLGWPKNTEALRTFHPTDVVVSGFDIIFFWIARMIMLTMHFIKNDNDEPQVPFRTIHITGLVRDEKGQKMSKFKGNVIDPIDIIDGISLADLIQKRIQNVAQPQLIKNISKHTAKQFPNGICSHGTDALRFTLAALASTGRDINWDMKRLTGYRNFCNKLWNASRFVFLNTMDKNQKYSFCNNYKPVVLTDRWIIAKFNDTVKEFRKALDHYRFDVAANILYEFIWHQFCNWYIEFTKSLLNTGSDIEKHSIYNTLIIILDRLLRLAHPIVPFITETIWQQIKVTNNHKKHTLMLQPFPCYDEKLEDDLAISDIEWIKQLIIAVRIIRIEMQISPNKLLTIILRQTTSTTLRIVNENLNLILSLARLHKIILLSVNDQGPIAATKSIVGAEILIPLTSSLNKDIELHRLAKEIASIDTRIINLTSKLDNYNFIKNAPNHVVKTTQKKLKNYQQYKIKLLQQQASISNL